MTLRTFTFEPYRLPFRQQWRSAAGGLDQREGWLVRLEDDYGGVGYGDCAPLSGIGTEPPAAAAAALVQWQQRFRGLEAAAALEALNDAASFDTPAARAGVESALLDLLARRNGRSLNASIRGCDCRQRVRVNASLGSLGPHTADTLESALEAGFQVLKLKIGLAPASQEIPLVQALCRRLPAGSTLRLDANRAWQEGDARSWLDALAGLPIDALEEPLAQPSAPAWAALQVRAAFPLALDESLADLPQAALFDFLPAVALAQRFAAAGGDCIVTSSLESACGLLAAAHLAAALGGDLAHGLATAEWLATDLGAPPPVAAGYLTLPAGPGLVFQPFATPA